jgi:hypothetical protein
MTKTFKGRVTGNHLRKDFNTPLGQPCREFQTSAIEFVGDVMKTVHRFEVEGLLPMGTEVQVRVEVAGEWAGLGSDWRKDAE